MPFIEVKTSVALTSEQKIELKSGLGEVITLIAGKTESVLMVGLIGDYDLYFAGEDIKGAYVEVKMFKTTTRESKTAVNDGICDLLTNVLNISREKIYITFFEQAEWGFKGKLL